MAWLEPETAHILLKRAGRGDTHAWERIVHSYSNLVYSVARQAGLSREDSEDVFQSTFIALHKNLDRIEHGSRLSRWLVVTAGRESVRIFRLQRRTTSTDESTELLEEVIQQDEQATEALILDGMQYEAAFAGFESLDERCRKLLSAIFSDQPVPYEQISNELGIPLGSIGPTRARCIESLRKILQKKHFFEEDVSRRRGRNSIRRNYVQTPK